MIGAVLTGSSANSQPAWLLTFVDLVLLLLTFFTMLFAVSRPDPVRYPVIAAAYRESFAADAIPVPPGSQSLSFARVPARAGDNLAYLEGVLRASFAQTPSLAALRFERANQYLILSLPAEIVFRPRAARLKSDTGETMFDLAGVLTNLRNPIAVVGRGDGWALGLNRAENFAAALTAAGLATPPAVLARAAASESIDVVIFADGGQS